MERFNQPPKTEGCLVEGQMPVNIAFDRVERPSRSVPREKREPQAGVASGLSNSASKVQTAGGDVVCLTEPNRKATASGEVVDHLPGSKSVARVEGDTRNWGGPSASRHSNYESQPGKLDQPKEGEPRGLKEGSRIHEYKCGAGDESGPRKGMDGSAKRAQETRTVRLTENPWPTSLLAKKRVDSKSPVRETLHAGIREGGAGQPVSLPRQIPNPVGVTCL